MDPETAEPGRPAEFAPGIYVVATPIGNLGDFSPRARAMLLAADVIAAEDTRVTKRLLGESHAAASFVSLTEHNAEQRSPGLIEAARDGVVVIVSDAGTPAVADPGTRVIQAAHAASVPVRTIPGPSALVAALSVAGMDATDVHFLGFLPKKQGERRSRLTDSAAAADTLVFFESPNRLADSLADVSAALGDPEVVVCRELTKLHEEAVRGSAGELARRFQETKGECTVVVDVSGFGEASSEDDAIEYLREMQRAGAQRSKAAAEAARRFGIDRSRAYDLWEGG